MTGKELSIKNLRILAFGDIHGRGVWKDVIDREGIDNLDLIVFLGDYFTSREGIPVEVQEENFRCIVDFKNAYPDKVVLLRGNHDMEACKYYWAECHPSHRSKWVVENKDWFIEYQRLAVYGKEEYLKELDEIKSTIYKHYLIETYESLIKFIKYIN